MQTHTPPTNLAGEKNKQTNKKLTMTNKPNPQNNNKKQTKPPTTPKKLTMKKITHKKNCPYCFGKVV